MPTKPNKRGGIGSLPEKKFRIMIVKMIQNLENKMVNQAQQDSTDATEGEAGGQASLISWHSYIGIPINFHEESGIVTF